METIELIYIGNDFYVQSKTSMSSIYQVLSDGNWKRWDWGFVQISLSEGHSIHIRPANEREMDIAHEKLQRLISK